MDETLEREEYVKEEPEALDPNGFREACVELLNIWEEQSDGPEPLEESFVIQFFQCRYEETYACWVNATERFYAAMDAVLVPPLCEFAASSEPGMISIDPVIFESAASAPLLEDRSLDVMWTMDDLGKRMLAIATLECLLGDEAI